MWWRKTMAIILFIAFAFSIPGCKKKEKNTGMAFERYGMGKVRDVVIVAADSSTMDLANYLASYLSVDTFYTPHPEPLFFVRVVDWKTYEDSLRGYRNTVVLATDNSPSAEIVKEAFGINSKYGIQWKKEALKEGGYMVAILEPDEAALHRFIDDSAYVIKNNLIERAYQIYKKMEYFAGVRKDIPKELLKNYGFTLELPNGYAYAVQDSHFVCLAKHYPDRFMFFYIQNSPRNLDPDSLMALRDSLTARYYEGDYILKDLCVVEADTFLGYNAVRVTGPWQNDKSVMGGPFRFYAFNRDGKFYMIDLAVYNPDVRYKLGFIMRLETIIRTMRFGK